MSDLHVDLAPGHKSGLRLANPVMLAAGVAGYGSEYGRLLPLDGLGAVVTTGITERRRRGAAGARVVPAPGSLVWATGYPNCGVDRLIAEHLPRWETRHARTIVNVCGRNPAEFAAVAAALEDQPDVAGLELNLLCLSDEDGWAPFCGTPERAAAVVRATRRACGLPILAKLGPACANPAAVATACLAAGANALTITGATPALRLEMRTGRPAHAPGAWLAGPAILPATQSLVWTIARAVSAPIVASGGITSADDALALVLAGATAVQVGSAIFAQPLTPILVLAGLAAAAAERGATTWLDLVGSAHRWLVDADEEDGEEPGEDER